MSVSTHILDTANGKPAAGVTVRLYQGQTLLNLQTTNADGRVPAMLPHDFRFIAGVYRLVFDVGAYFREGFFPEVAITFEVKNAAAHHHVPLLLSPFGYTTYRGS